MSSTVLCINVTCLPDAVHWILSKLINQDRTANGVRKKLKELFLIVPKAVCNFNYLSYLITFPFKIVLKKVACSSFLELTPTQRVGRAGGGPVAGTV